MEDYGAAQTYEKEFILQAGTSRAPTVQTNQSHFYGEVQQP